MKSVIFTADEVQATQDRRKTQFRRVIKPQPEMAEPDEKNRIPVAFYNGERWVKCRYQPGDILYVRETWNFITCKQCKRSEEHSDFNSGCVTPLSDRDRYKDEYGCFVYRANYGYTEDDSFPPSLFKWRPSIHMPKEAARLFLQVKSIMPERLQDISGFDCVCEGVSTLDILENTPEKDFEEYAILQFNKIWDKQNASKCYSWESNPWVWKIEFERMEKP